MTMQENSLSLSEANMMIHENGTKLFSSHELRQLKTNQLETSYMFRENEHLISDYIVTDKNGDNHFYSIEKWPSLEIVACGIRKLETALFIASSLNQTNNPPSINWQPIEKLDLVLLMEGKQMVLFNKKRSFGNTYGFICEDDYEEYGEDVRSLWDDVKTDATHYALLTPPKP